MAAAAPMPLAARPLVLPRGRLCHETCLELLAIEVVHHYARQDKALAAGACLEAIGLRVGRQLAERYSRDRPRMTEPLDVVKFICKEFWAEVFRKQVDNLRTNHRGTFVLKDTNFRWLSRLSPDAPAAGAPPAPAGALAALAADYLFLPCGMLKGALAALGVECTVTADASNLPACDFTVNIKQR